MSKLASDVNLTSPESHRKSEPQLRAGQNILAYVYVCEVFSQLLVNLGWSQPTLGCVIHKPKGLDGGGKQAEQDMSSQPISIILLWSLLQFLT